MGETVVATRTPLKSVYVAAELCRRQGRMENFMNGMRRYLGRTASVRTVGEMHTTFLESRGVKEMCYDFGYTNREIMAFQAGLQHFLDRKGYGQPTTARVNLASPLRWAGNYFKVALNLLPDEPLMERRSHIETYLVNQFGRLPNLTGFEPHITIGRVDMTRLDPEIAEDARYDANELLPPGLVVPSTVSLEGLNTYLSRIHPPYRTTLAQTG